MSEAKSETPNADVTQPGRAPVNGSAAASKWEIWPLMMALGFVCMAKSNGWAELIPRVLTVAALTYSISHRLCRRQNILDSASKKMGYWHP
jgi:hypothetical protein